jgi:hypothetical protein
MVGLLIDGQGSLRSRVSLLSLWAGRPGISASSVDCPALRGLPLLFTLPWAISTSHPSVGLTRRPTVRPETGRQVYLSLLALLNHRQQLVSPRTVESGVLPTYPDDMSTPSPLERDGRRRHQGSSSAEGEMTRPPPVFNGVAGRSTAQKLVLGSRPISRLD